MMEFQIIHPNKPGFAYSAVVVSEDGNQVGAYSFWDYDNDERTAELRITELDADRKVSRIHCKAAKAYAYLYAFEQPTAGLGLKQLLVKVRGDDRKRLRAFQHMDYNEIIIPNWHAAGIHQHLFVLTRTTWCEHLSDRYLSVDAMRKNRTKFLEDAIIDMVGLDKAETDYNIKRHDPKLKQRS